MTPKSYSNQIRDRVGFLTPPFLMYFLLEQQLNQRIAHPSTCPEIPLDRGSHHPEGWQEFASAAAIQEALIVLRARGFDAHWCRCQVCRVLRGGWR